MRIDRRAFILSCSASPAILLAGCGDSPQTLRYRMTIEIDTPEGLRTGSTVVELWLARSGGGGPPYAMGKRGEALVVDLGRRGRLFALLVGAHGDPGYCEMLPERVIAPALHVYPHPTTYDADRLGVFRQLAEHRRGDQIDLSFDKLPMLVRFRDIGDPRTVERVEPSDLTKSFGAGISLKRATIEITDDSLTAQIESYAPSYRNRADWFEWFRKLPYGDARQFGPEAFRTGF